MKTYKISKEDIKELKPLAVGYKAVKWDLSTNGTSGFRYGEVDEDIVGTIWKVDGAIKECNWGLHFSKDPANVFNFYEPLGYNRYFKINAYDTVIDTQDGLKSVAQIIEFMEEYDLMQFIDEIKKFDRTISYSNGIYDSYGISSSKGISNSDGIYDSYGISSSKGISYSYGIVSCEAVKSCLFCYKKDAIKYYIFNKKVLKDRFSEVYDKILSFGFYPQYINWNEVKGNKEWWAFNFKKLAKDDNPWRNMPTEMLEYIKSLPEYNKEIFNKITGGLDV